MTEHEKHCVNHCPTCGGKQHDGYRDLDFGGDAANGMCVFVRFYCHECEQEYVERYTYDATWYETSEVGTC